MFNGQSNTKTTIGVEQYLPTKPATNCFETPFVDGQEIQKLKSNEFQRINRRLWCGVASASRAWWAIILSIQLWMAPTTFKFFKTISSAIPESNSVDDGDFNKITIPNTKVGWLSNFIQRST